MIEDFPDEETANKVINGMHKKKVRGMKIRVEKAMTSKAKTGHNAEPRSFSISSSSLSSKPDRRHRKVSDQKEESKSLLSIESCNPRIRERSYMRDEEVDESRRERPKYASDIKDYTLGRIHHINNLEDLNSKTIDKAKIVEPGVENKENNQNKIKTVVPRQKISSLSFNYKSLTPEENERVNKLLSRVNL